MKHINLCLLCIIVFTACRKNLQSPTQDQNLINSARNYFTSHFSETKQISIEKSGPAAQYANPDWPGARTVTLANGLAVIVPLHYSKETLINTTLDPTKIYSLTAISSLVMYPKKDNSFSAELCVVLPDSNYIQEKNFSGIIDISDWDNNMHKQLKFDKGKIYRPASINTTVQLESTHKPATAILETCYSATGYNYSVDDPDNGYYYTIDLGCDYSYVDDYGGSAGGIGLPSLGSYGAIGGSTAAITANTIMVNRGNNPIQNVHQYIQCFQNTTGATYSISLLVDQPSPGKRASYSSSPSINVGHVFVTFQQNNSGVITRRTMGLYPSGPVTPVTPSSPGSLNDDESHHYNIGIIFIVDGSQFISILNAFSYGNNVNYNLNSNNCTTWALSSLAAGGIDIATHQGSWPFGHGDDPGDLGEDLRTLPLSTGMSRNTQGGYALSNIGSCQPND